MINRKFALMNENQINFIDPFTHDSPFSGRLTRLNADFLVTEGNGTYPLAIWDVVNGEAQFLAYANNQKLIGRKKELARFDVWDIAGERLFPPFPKG